ncbi:type II toxin-antitoxin system HicB family antitoxin [bacterium]|nr:type II toxin-antitoxin system HicB family antitoxin [bacterium]
MIFKIIIHEEPEGGFWAEVPSLPGCASQGDNIEELLENIKEAIQGCLKAGAEVVPHNTEIMAVSV